MATHITEAAAAADLHAVLARVRAGEEIVIESESQLNVVICSAAFPRRSISETIARAEASSRELGYAPVMDADFAEDVEEIIRNRRPRDTSAWD